MSRCTCAIISQMYLQCTDIGYHLFGILAECSSYWSLLWLVCCSWWTLSWSSCRQSSLTVYKMKRSWLSCCRQRSVTLCISMLPMVATSMPIDSAGTFYFVQISVLNGFVFYATNAFCGTQLSVPLPKFWEKQLPHAKFLWNRTTGCWIMAKKRFSTWLPSAISNLF